MPMTGQATLTRSRSRLPTPYSHALIPTPYSPLPIADCRLPAVPLPHPPHALLRILAFQPSRFDAAAAVLAPPGDELFPRGHDVARKIESVAVGPEPQQQRIFLARPAQPPLFLL